MAIYYPTTIRGTQAFSDLVLGYVESSDIGFPFLEMRLTKTATMKVGSVVNNTGAEVASAAGAYGVIVRSDLLFGWEDLPVGAVFDAVVAVRAATLNRYLCFYSNGDLIDAAGVAALETRGLKLTDKLVKTS